MLRYVGPKITNDIKSAMMRQTPPHYFLKQNDVVLKQYVNYITIVKSTRNLAIANRS